MNRTARTRRRPLAPILGLVLPGLLALLLARPAWGQGPHAPAESGARAAPGRWTMEGGCASAAGVSLAPALRATPVVAWSVRPGGELEGEPVAFDGLVLVTARSGAGRRTLSGLELDSGRVLLHQVLPASVPLRTAIWKDRVFVRPEPNRVDVYRIRAGRLQSLRTIRATASISPPVVLEGRLYLRVDAELRAYDPASAEPLWTARPRGSFLGTPSVRGDRVYALRTEPDGAMVLDVLDRITGKSTQALSLGAKTKGVLSAEPPRPVILDDAVLVTSPTGFASAGGATRGSILLSRGADGVSHTPSVLLDVEASPVDLAPGWVARLSGQRSAWLTARLGTDGLLGTTLASEEEHPELLAGRAPATRTGDTVYLAGIAFDVSTGDILWKRAPTLARAVPVDGSLLVVETADTLTALREDRGARSHAELRAEELERTERAKAAEALALLAGRAARLADAELVARLIDEAVARGARGRAVDAARDALERIGTGRPAGADPRRRASYEEEERRLLAAPVDALLEAAFELGDPALRRALLRRVLTARPDEERARAAVLAMLPADAPAHPERADPLSWLDFLDVTAEAPVRILDPGRSSGQDAELAPILQARPGWRDDLIGVRSERLLIVAGPDHPGEVARCLEIGERVCDRLERFFGTQAGDADHALVLYLYDSRERYVAQSRRAGSVGEDFLGWTVGHYSPREDVSRMFVPAAEAKAARFLGTYAHELTHHWLQDRAPFQYAAPAEGTPYWIVEGFARMVEESDWDAAQARFVPVPSRAESLDLVAGSAEADLLPWAELLAMDQAAFRRLSSEGRLRVSRSWSLGQQSEVSELGLFYGQAAALAHWLGATAEGRERLRTALSGWYEGEPRRLAPTTLLGPEAARLGPDLRAWATRQVSGR